jgi:hypothetical protein
MKVYPLQQVVHSSQMGTIRDERALTRDEWKYAHCTCYLQVVHCCALTSVRDTPFPFVTNVNYS